MKKKFLIIGGDERIVYLADILKKNNFDIKIFGNDKIGANLCTCASYDLKSAVEDCDIIILPLPVSKDKNHINAPFFSERIPIDDFASSLKSRHTVIGGSLPDTFKNILEAKNIKYFDYFKNETLTMKNALITAEGAVMLAIKNTDISLLKSKCMVLGYGRIAKFLVRMLKGFGADCTVCARKESALAEAEAIGCAAYPLDKMSFHLNSCDIIFNTIPKIVLTTSELLCIKDDAIIIDLASIPGGVDLTAAKTLDINLISALSLPGKIAPKSAGEIIFKAICSILNQMGEDIYDA